MISNEEQTGQALMFLGAVIFLLIAIYMGVEYSKPTMDEIVEAACTVPEINTDPFWVKRCAELNKETK